MKNTLAYGGALTLLMICAVVIVGSFAVHAQANNSQPRGDNTVDSHEIDERAQSEARIPPPSILGIELATDRRDTERRLREIGERVPTELEDKGDYKQLWRLDDEHFASALVRFDDDFKVKWITAYARTDGERLRFENLGDPVLARQSGRYIYAWRVDANEERSGYLFQARGTTPEFVSSVSLTGVERERRSTQHLHVHPGVEE